MFTLQAVERSFVSTAITLIHKFSLIHRLWILQIFCPESHRANNVFDHHVQRSRNPSFFLYLVTKVNREQNGDERFGQKNLNALCISQDCLDRGNALTFGVRVPYNIKHSNPHSWWTTDIQTHAIPHNPLEGNALLYDYPENLATLSLSWPSVLCLGCRNR